MPLQSLGYCLRDLVSTVVVAGHVDFLSYKIGNSDARFSFRRALMSLTKLSCFLFQHVMVLFMCQLVHGFVGNVNHKKELQEW